MNLKLLKSRAERCVEVSFLSEPFLSLLLVSVYHNVSSPLRHHVLQQSLTSPVYLTRYFIDIDLVGPKF